jgi:hypothetical protein
MVMSADTLISILIEAIDRYDMDPENDKRLVRVEVHRA